MARRARKIRGTPRKARPRPAVAASSRGRNSEPTTAVVLVRLREALHVLERALRRLDEPE